MRQAGPPGSQVASTKQNALHAIRVVVARCQTRSWFPCGAYHHTKGTNHANSTLLSKVLP